MDSLQDMWQAVLELVCGNHSDVEGTLWLKVIKPLSFEQDALTLTVPNDFKKKVITEKYDAEIREKLIEVFGFPVETKYINEEEQVEAESNNRISGENENNFYGGNVRDIKSADYEFSFDNYVVGPSNKFAYAASNRVAEKPGVVYNPLLIYGRSGLGKTHLLLAIYHKIMQNNPNAVVHYTTGENFMNEFVKCLQNRDTESFHNKYRYADVLLIDDIHFIAGKQQIQEEFFHTFNALKGANKQIVMTSDRPPKEMATLEERLRTRFESGLLADVQIPELETRMAIIRKKAMKENVEIPDNVVQYIAENLKSNIRQLEGIVMNISSQATMLERKIDLAMAKEQINDMVSGNVSVEEQIKQILTAVCEFYGIPASDVQSNSRQATIIQARQICMYIMREVMQISLNEIGAVFGGKNHSTVNYSINQVIAQMRDDTAFRTNVNDIIRNVQEYVKA